MQKTLLNTKKPASFIAGGLGYFFLISLAALLQAMAVRRHGCPMVEMAVMAGALHLYSS
jgi:hypothetical protein